MPAKRSQGLNIIWIGTTLLAIGLAMKSINLLLLVMCLMIPSIVFLLTDNSYFRSWRSTAIAGFNGAAAVWVGMRFMEQGMSQRLVQEMISDIFVWATVLLATALGWIILHFAPVIAAAIIQMNRREQLRKLETIRRKLLDDWGGTLMDGGKDGD